MHRLPCEASLRETPCRGRSCCSPWWRAAPFVRSFVSSLTRIHVDITKPKETTLCLFAFPRSRALLDWIGSLHPFLALNLPHTDRLFSSPGRTRSHDSTAFSSSAIERAVHDQTQDVCLLVVSRNFVRFRILLCDFFYGFVLFCFFCLFCGKWCGTRLFMNYGFLYE